MSHKRFKWSGPLVFMDLDPVCTFFYSEPLLSAFLKKTSSKPRAAVAVQKSAPP